MSLSINSDKLRGLTQRGRAIYGRLAGYQAETERVVGQVVQTLEVSAASFGLGYLQGRKGPVDILGVPVDIGAALALHAVGFLGLAGKKYSEHLNNFGDGALSAYLSSKGSEIGLRHRQDTEGGVSGIAGRRRRPILETARTRAAAVQQTGVPVRVQRSLY